MRWWSPLFAFLWYLAFLWASTLPNYQLAGALVSANFVSLLILIGCIRIYLKEVQ
jgi:hypothetical protein